MKAAQAYRGHFLPKKCFGKRTLRECSTSEERDNIVLIEVDSDDFGDVIILDIPESFQEKFRKNQDPHVIELDDEDDDVSDTSPSDTNVNTTTGRKYGLTPDSESSSESDGSDCELMEGFKSCVDQEKSNCFQCDDDTEDVDILLGGFSSNGATEDKPSQEFEFSSPNITCKEHSVGTPSVPFNDSTHCRNSEPECSSDQNNVLTDRQKMKETDEYKRAMEEEWASRQLQLQRQAEEAQRLRIKKRAERMRIMDNERRQKQRLEEIRETRRKDEENLNLKDKLRAEIRNELHMLEIMCSDMVSLLRCLGIPIPPFPSPSEVQAAYKRACLKFHPDRLSSTDLRQQVEAEEKFKLISTMKEKFLK